MSDWSNIIFGINDPQVFASLPPPGGYSKQHPAVCTSVTGKTVELVTGKNGRKKIKHIKVPKSEKRLITKDEALENPQKTFKWLLQYNEKKDKEWEESQMNRFV